MITDIIDAIGKENIESAVSTAIADYISSNMDLHEELVEQVVSAINEDSTKVTKIADAVTARLCEDIEAGTVEVLSTSALDSLLGNIGSFISNRVNSAFSTGSSQ